jgi:hypothetical protein
MDIRAQTNRINVGIAALAVVAIILGVVIGIAWNNGRTNRDTAKDLLINNAADPSTYVFHGDTPVGFTVPLRNDSPFTVTLTYLHVPGMPKASWSGTATKIQPGATAAVAVTAPPGCVVKTGQPLPFHTVVVWLIVRSANGDSTKLTLSVPGIAQSVQQQCGKYVPPGVSF